MSFNANQEVSESWRKGKKRKNKNKFSNLSLGGAADIKNYEDLMDFEHDQEEETKPALNSSDALSEDFISIKPGVSDQNSSASREGGRWGHPPGLRGREIGLWYAKQNKLRRPQPPPGLTGKELLVWRRNQKKEDKRKRREERDREPCIVLSLDHDKEITIRQLVDSIKTPLQVPIQTHIPERKIYKKLSRRSPSPEEVRPLIKEASWNLMEKIKKEAEEETKPINVNDKYQHMEESQFKKIFLRSITGSMTENVNNALQIKSKLSRHSEIDIELKQDMMKKQMSPGYQKMQEFRRKLPAWEKQEELLDLVEKNQVVVISGETGCGKTTQVAQFILDKEIESGRGSACHIVCTQPRRISAISVAERVAAERNEEVGRDSVGYVIRLEAEPPRARGSIKFCTTGVLLRMLELDPALTEVSHLILDEIHERDTVSDFAITILKDIIPKRSDLRLILMSATLNAEDFSKYYNNCVMVNIPGFTFPVKEYYLEDVLEMTRFIPRINNSQNQRRNQIWKMKNKEKAQWTEFKGMVHPYLRELESSRKYSREVTNFLYEPESENISLDLILELIKYIHNNEGEGAILVFLPGWDKISTLNKLLKEEGMSERTGCLVIPLHSMISTASQRKVFDRPPRGVRKIVIATNIAETSITIDDVVFVIDCGKIKMKNFDVDQNLSTLKEEWVSLANARQRRGRAGRVKEGVCYHMFTRARENLLEQYPVPEMLRTRLEEVILQAKMLQLGSIKPFLSRVMNPPNPKAIDLSLKLLQDLNALDQDECLTPLGYHLAKLPMDPQTGKMILMAAMFRVIDPIFSVAASLSFKDAFTVPIEREVDFFRKKKELSFGTKSDHLVLAEALTRWEAECESNGGWQFAREYYLSTSTLKMLVEMKKQFGSHLHEMKFLSTQDVKDQHSNQNSHNIGLVKAIICAGLYPNVAIIRSVKKNKRSGFVVQKIFTPEDGRVCIHFRSINYDQAEFEGRFLVYHMKMKTKDLNLYDTSMVFALPLIFFGHNFELFTENGSVVIELSPKIRFTCPASTALLVKELRQRLDQLLEYKVAHPGVTDWDEESDEGKLLKAIAELISHEDEKLSVMDDSDDEDEECEEESDDSSSRRGNINFHGNSSRFGRGGRANHRGFSSGPRRNYQHPRHHQGPSRGGRYGSKYSSDVVPFPRF